MSLLLRHRAKLKTALYVIEIFAVLVFAYSAMFDALASRLASATLRGCAVHVARSPLTPFSLRRAHKSAFDYVGALTIALVMALGGGTLRDVLLGNHPLYWIAHWEFLIYVLVLSPIARLLLHFKKDFSSQRSLVLIDAAGLGLFTTSGTAVALEMKTPILAAALIGVTTATFGGVLRDVLCNEKPQLFQPTEPLYAT